MEYGGLKEIGPRRPIEIGTIRKCGLLGAGVALEKVFTGGGL